MRLLMKSKTISVIGLGYIGLPTAALLANHGYNVVGVDINKKAVDAINLGGAHIFEPELEAAVQTAVNNGHLRASTLPQAADIYIICVPTPILRDNPIPKPDIKSVLTAAASISSILKPGDLVILESTSPVGTTEQIESIFRQAGAPSDKVEIAYCPERVLPGRIMVELVENDRIVGGMTASATSLAAEFYRTFVRGSVLETDAKTAELCKLAENSFRDVNIAFANELSLICDREGISVWNLIRLANHHPRVNILQPGPGVGGHCIAVDPWFIVSRDVENAKLIRTAREVNNHKTSWVINKIKVTLADRLVKNQKLPKIVCLGLAFKPDIDDLRESSAIKIAMELRSAGFNVAAVEPNIKTHEHIPLIDLEEAFDQANVIAVLVRHRQFILPSVKIQLTDLKALDFCGALI